LRQGGVTLIELVLFIVIVGIALAGIVTMMNLTTRGSTDPLRRKQALIIAEGLLEEVQLAKFSWCDPASANADTAANSAACDIPENWGQLAPEPSGGANGRPYDNVNDYVTAPGVLTAAFDNAAGVLVDAAGNPLGVDGYRVRLSIRPAALGPAAAPIGSDAGASADTDVLRITVQVDFDGQTLTLDGYRTRYAPNHL
jgi:MSHA pilin protein MshD